VTSDLAHIQQAAAALDDEYARQPRACEEVLKTEADVQRRRVAANRYVALTEQSKRAA
jgi:hypothetical protein